MGWPVEWLKQTLSADEFDLWCQYYRRYPFDDRSNHHVPLAALQSQLSGFMGGTPKPLSSFLIFRQNDATSDIDRQLLAGNW